MTDLLVPDKPYHAWYSAAADKEQGHTIWHNEHGQEVKCTGVTEQRDGPYYWADAQYRGVVVRFGREVRTEVQRRRRRYVEKEFPAEELPDE